MSKFRFNWVDAVIIILVIAVCFLGYYYLKNRNSVSGVTQTSKLYFVFETDKNSKDIAEQFTVGTQVTFGVKNVDKGVITQANVVPYTHEVADAVNGKWFMRDIPGLYCAQVRIEFDGYETANSFGGSAEQIMAGLGTVISGKGINSEGYVLDVGEVATRSN